MLYTVSKVFYITFQFFSLLVLKPNPPSLVSSFLSIGMLIENSTTDFYRPYTQYTLIDLSWQVVWNPYLYFHAF